MNKLFVVFLAAVLMLSAMTILSVEAQNSVETIAELNTHNVFFAVQDDYIYFINWWGTERGQASLNRVPIAGGQIETYIGNLETPRDIITDNTFVYWTNARDERTHDIYKMPIGGGNKIKLLNSQDLISLNGRGFQVKDGVVYFIETNSGAVKSVSSEGSVKTLAYGPRNAWENAIDDKNVYWIQDNHLLRKDGSLNAVSLTGGPYKNIANLNNPSSLTTDLDSVYVVDDNADAENYPSEWIILKFSKDGKSQSELFRKSAEPYDIKYYNGYVYFQFYEPIGNYEYEGRIGRVRVNDGVFELVLSVDKSKRIEDFEINNNVLYWSETSLSSDTGAIKRLANPSGIQAPKATPSPTPQPIQTKYEPGVKAGDWFVYELSSNDVPKIRDKYEITEVSGTIIKAQVKISHLNPDGSEKSTVTATFSYDLQMAILALQSAKPRPDMLFVSKGLTVGDTVYEGYLIRVNEVLNAQFDGQTRAVLYLKDEKLEIGVGESYFDKETGVLLKATSFTEGKLTGIVRLVDTNLFKLTTPFDVPFPTQTPAQSPTPTKPSDPIKRIAVANDYAAFDEMPKWFTEFAKLTTPIAAHIVIETEGNTERVWLKTNASPFPLLTEKKGENIYLLAYVHDQGMTKEDKEKALAMGIAFFEGPPELFFEAVEPYTPQVYLTEVTVEFKDGTEHTEPIDNIRLPTWADAAKEKGQVWKSQGGTIIRVKSPVYLLIDVDGKKVGAVYENGNVRKVNEVEGAYYIAETESVFLPYVLQNYRIILSSADNAGDYTLTKLEFKDEQVKVKEVQGSVEPKTTVEYTSDLKPLSIAVPTPVATAVVGAIAETETQDNSLLINLIVGAVIAIVAVAGIAVLRKRKSKPT